MPSFALSQWQLITRKHATSDLLSIARGNCYSYKIFGLLRYLFRLPFLHRAPLNPGAQLQLNPFTRSVQVPLFLQGWLVQSSISVLEDKSEMIKIHRGYNTVARRYEFYVRVARTIPHEWAQRTSGILFLPREHQIHIFELRCYILYVCSKHTADGFFDDYSEDFRPLSEDFRRFSKIVLKARRMFPFIFRKFPKISEDCGRLPKTFEEDPNMFRWYNNECKYNLRDKLDISKIIDIFTCKNIFISSHIVSFLLICYHSVYHWLVYSKNRVNSPKICRKMNFGYSYLFHIVCH